MIANTSKLSLIPSQIEQTITDYYNFVQGNLKLSLNRSNNGLICCDGLPENLLF